jgi:hypothetical protein
MTGASNEIEWAADRKVGFAMGILLIGVVAALFFRNEPLSVKDTPSIGREELIDSRLRDRDVSVYADDRHTGEEGQQAWTLPELLNQFEQHDAGVVLPIGQAKPPAASVTQKPGDSTVSRTARETPSFEPPAAAFDRLSDSAPESGEPDSVAFSLETEPVGDKSDESRRGSYDEYTVRYGDTLSEIADKLLGSPNRYQEIYDANRDRMASPDRLKVGAAIRIPRL